MNELVSVGVILLLALLAGHVVKLLRMPEVTGYLLLGVALGPRLLGWVSDSNLAALGVLSDVALGLILFSIGTVFELDQFRRIGRKLGTVTLCEALLTCGLVTSALLIAGQPWPIAAVLGVMAIETAAASTLMVIREANASGPVTQMLTGVFALDNLVCLLLFNIMITVVQFSGKGGAGGETFGSSVFRIAWQFLGAMALGYLIGWVLSAWSLRVVEHGEQLILLAGCVLLCVGAAKWLEVSALVANLTIGATVVNLSHRSRKLFESLSQTDPPLYAIFFVLAGANLDASKLMALGLAGAVYVLGRLFGKVGGTMIGTRLAGLSPVEQKWLPRSMLAQAGLAVGLTLTLSDRLPELAPAITAIVLSAVIIFEILGPFAVRWSLLRSGESHERVEVAPGILS
jgi:Kef-type K+ transport system membrane component KefB